MTWDGLNSPVKAMLGVVALGGSFWAVSEFIAAVKMQPQALAQQIQVVEKDVDDVEHRVQRMEKRYNKHVETQYKDWKMNKEAPPTTVKQPTPPPRPN